MKNYEVFTRPGLLLIAFAMLSAPLISYSQLADSNVVMRSPYDVSDSLMFGWVPQYQHDSIPAYTGSSNITTDYQPSGSFWDPGCDEEDVFLARMIHKEGDSVHWNLGVGRAGIIYSFIGPYGEGVPPQVHSSGDFNLAPWIDEVWQIVSVNNQLNNTDLFPAPPGTSLASTVRSLPYFIHGAGAYRNDTMYLRKPDPFYSPLMASWYNEKEKAIYTTNWGTQAHIPSLHKSGLLYTYKYKDIGNGIMENTMVIQNFGDVPVQYHNMPWGGVRASSLPQQWLSKPDNSLERNYQYFGGEDAGILNSIDQSGGFFIWAAEGEDENRPALAVVFGLDKNKSSMPSGYATRLRWGLTGGVERSYTVFVLNPVVDINPGASFFFRIFYINGTMKEVHEKAKKIKDATDYGFIHADPETVARTVIKPADHFHALKEDISLFAEPVPGNIPLFLMENTRTGKRYISPDLYHDAPTLPFDNPYDPSDPKYETYQNRIVYRQYDGTIKYLRLLGYGIKKGSSAAHFRWAMLDTMITDQTRVILPPDYRNRIWIPVEPCDTCRVEPEPVPGTGYRLYNDFGSKQEIPWTNPVNLDFADNVPNPDTSDANPSFKVGRVVRGSGQWANIHFDLPQDLDLRTHYNFKLKVNRDLVSVPDMAKISFILRKDGDGSTQYQLNQYILSVNAWKEYTFSCPDAHLRNDYNQLWFYFSSPDDSEVATGYTYYIDDLMGPPLTIKEEDIMIRTNPVGDSIILDFSSHPHPLKWVDRPVFSLVRNGTEPISVHYAGHDSAAIYLHPEQGAGIEGRDSLALSFVSGTVEDAKGYILTAFSGHPVENIVPPDPTRYIRFVVTNAETKQLLGGITIRLDSLELATNTTGEALFKTDTGYHSFHIQEPEYFEVDSAIALTDDIVLKIMLIRSVADIKFKILSDGIPVYKAVVTIGEDQFLTSSVGVTLFPDLARFEEYSYTVSKAGYYDTSGQVLLMDDTVMTVSLNKDYTAVEDWASTGLLLYPNPAGTSFSVESDREIRRITLYSVYGRELSKKPVHGQLYQMDVSSLGQGVYILNLEWSDGSSVIRRLVISR